MCLALLLIYIISTTLGDNQVSKELFNRSIEQFEDVVNKEETLSSSYVTIYDYSDNRVSLFFKKVSEGCVKVIEFIALVFSNFISMIMTYVVYY